MAPQQQILDNWLGKRVNDPSLASTGLPSSKWFQCVSWIKQVLREGYGLNPGQWGDAYKYWTNPNPALLAAFDKVQTKSVQAGDIVIYPPAPSNGGGGHIQWAISSSQATEQNGGTGTGTGLAAYNDEIRIASIHFDTMYGVLRPKVIQGDNMTQEAIERLVMYAYRVATDIDATPEQAGYWVERIRNDNNTAGELLAALGGNSYQGDPKFRDKARSYDKDLAAATNGNEAAKKLQAIKDALA